MEVSSAEDDAKIKLIDSSSDHEEGNGNQVKTRFNPTISFVLDDDP